MDENEQKSIELADLDKDMQTAYHLQVALQAMKDNKPNDRSPTDRHWAVAITDMERVIAYFDYFIMRYDPEYHSTT
jgi:hypothetical protein